jgi:hypothetical protein
VFADDKRERVVVYSALGSHACYSRPGTVLRVAGLLNDRNDAQGALWNLRPNVLEYPKSLKLDFKGASENAPNQPWWRLEGENSNRAGRMFMLFPVALWHRRKQYSAVNRLGGGR